MRAASAAPCLCIGYLGEMIQRDFGDGEESGMKLDYSFDGEKLLGTGGAIKRALPLLGEEFFVLYGDSYLPVEYAPIAEFFHRSGKLGCMTVYRNEGKYDTSNVVFAGGEIEVYDKKAKLPEMRHIDYGLSLFKAVGVRCVFRRPAFRPRRSHGQARPGKATRRLRGARAILRNRLACGLGRIGNLLRKAERWCYVCSQRGGRGMWTLTNFASIHNRIRNSTMSFTKEFLAEVQQVTAQLNADAIEKCADELARCASAADVCSSSASAAARATPATP